MKLRTPEAHELEALSALCLRSKAVWGYDQAFLDACQAELTIRVEELETTAICVAEHDGMLFGVAQIVVHGDVADLNKMFIEPSAIGLGVGKVLFAWVITSAKSFGVKRLTIDAEPGAAGFYTKMGAIEHGLVPSGSIPGRMLPHFRVEFKAAAAGA